jgi:hypothetical protein
MKRRIAAVAVAVAVASTAVMAGVNTISLPACATEDSVSCHWDASRGNGLGRSFDADAFGNVRFVG